MHVGSSADSHFVSVPIYLPRGKSEGFIPSSFASSSCSKVLSCCCDEPFYYQRKHHLPQLIRENAPQKGEREMTTQQTTRWLLRTVERTLWSAMKGKGMNDYGLLRDEVLMMLAVGGAFPLLSVFYCSSSSSYSSQQGEKEEEEWHVQ
jgi:hypothetical protein